MAESAPPTEQPAVGERLLDPELRLQHGRDIAWQALNRRDRTTGELRRLLAAKRVEPEVIEQVVAEVVEQGYVDDRRYATQFATDKRELEGWGSDRIRRKLTAAGLPRELVEEAVCARDPDDELSAALELLARRFPEPPRTPRERDRMLGVLIRKGFASDLAYAAVRRHAGADEFFDG
jgi:regulatory protein